MRWGKFPERLGFFGQFGVMQKCKFPFEKEKRKKKPCHGEKKELLLLLYHWYDRSMYITCRARKGGGGGPRKPKRIQDIIHM